MNPTCILDRIPLPEKPEATAPETDYSLNVAFVYQDERTRKWAWQVYDQVTELAGKEAVEALGGKLTAWAIPKCWPMPF